MNLKVKIGGNTLERSTPDAPDQLGFKKFLEMHEVFSSDSTILKKLSVWYDVSEEVLGNFPAEKYDELVGNLWFGTEAAKYIMLSEYPQFIKIEGKPYLMPLKKDGLNHITLADIAQVDAYTDLGHHQMIAAFAVYAAPHILSNGKFEKALKDEYIAAAERIPAVIGYPIAAFFLSKRQRPMRQSPRFSFQSTPSLMDWSLWGVLALSTLLTLWLLAT